MGQASRERISKVIIAGGGTAGWMAAAFLATRLGRNLEITLVESEQIGTVGVGEATIPPIQLFNKAVGIKENDFLKHTKGTFKLGIQFQNWGKFGDKYMHAFGMTGHNLGMTPFHHYFFRARHEGMKEGLWDYSFNDLAANAGRFAPTDKIEGSPLAGLVHAYHFDAGLYAGYLRKLAKSRGVTRVEGKIASVGQDSETGFLTSLTLESGAVIEGDFFVDCTGFRSLLLGEQLGVEFYDLGHLLPCDTAIAVQSENVAPPQPYTQSIAHAAGWQWRIPLQHRTGNGHVFSSAYMSEDEAASILLGNLDGELVTEPRTIKFQTGRRQVFWEKNCLAVGLSSGFLEPLESTSIHLIQSAIVRLAKMFPSRGITDTVVQEYNRQAVAEFDNISDFIVLHYCLNQRTDSDFWRYCAAMELPERLRRKIDLYLEDGFLFREDDELFTEGSWLHVLLGQNAVPKGYCALADDISSKELTDFMANLRTIMNGAVKRLPAHEAYIAKFCASA
ncbi:tryptophan halogenase family protein [Kordiimonas sp.]|uniref:tryptophan halogenase family protein n=1 Tax=Kordiimonas sp. TaxID=1970157 RepID=UPI003A912B1E